MSVDDPSEEVSEVDSVVEALSSPDSQDVYFATLPYNPHALASVAARIALAGGGGGGGFPDAASNVITKFPAIVADPNELDRTGVSDCSSVLQAYLDQLETNRGGQVLLPYGKFYCATGLTCDIQGAEIVGVGMPGVTDDLATGSTDIIVGDGEVGLTLGPVGSPSLTHFRGYRVSNLMFYEKNAGQAVGGLHIYNSADCYFDRVASGAFTAGYGILNDADAPVNGQYNTFLDCRVGRALYGYRQNNAIGTIWLGGQSDGSANGTFLPLANSIGFYVESGDTFMAFGTKALGYEDLWVLGSPGFHHLEGIRCEFWSGIAVHVLGGDSGSPLFASVGRKIHISGSGDNSLIHGVTTITTDYGTVIEAGAEDVVDEMQYENLSSPSRWHVNHGTRTRYPTRSGATTGAALVGNVVGKQAVYDGQSRLIGYSPIYDAITGTAVLQVQEIDFDITGSGVTSLVLQVPATVTTGNTILLAVGCAYPTSAVTFSATDSKGNTYAVDKYQDGHTEASVTPHAAVLRSTVTTDLVSGDTITVSVNHTVNYLGVNAYEYEGLLTVSPLDKTAGATGNSTTPSSGAVSTTAQAHELLFAAIYFEGAGSFTPGAGYTLNRSNFSAATSIAAESEVIFATGTPAASGTIASGGWSAALATYKAA